MTILNEIAKYARIRVDKDREKLPLEELRELVKTSSFNREEVVFEKALSGEEMSFICEVKKASPSKGIIDEIFDYMGIALA